MLLTSSDEDEFYDAKEVSSPQLSRTRETKRHPSTKSRGSASVATLSTEIQSPLNTKNGDLSVSSLTLDSARKSDSQVALGDSYNSLDPLSAHIVRRASQKLPLKLLSKEKSCHNNYDSYNAYDVSESLGNNADGRKDESRKLYNASLEDHSSTQKKKIAKDILSRLGIFNCRKAHKNQEQDEESECISESSSSSCASEPRESLESSRSSFFSQSNNSYILPPHNASYVKVKSKSNLVKRHTRIVLAQILTAKKNKQQTSNEKPKSPKDATDAVWTMKFSKDGQYMASGGKLCIVYVWKVLSSPDKLEDNSIKVFEQVPFRKYCGHTSDVLDISWSKSNFLLSCSMDKTVRLWHVTREECLCVFKHLDIVTGIDFHPRDDRYFLSGSLDCKVRLWSIPDKNVSFWNELPSGQMITAVGFTRDGNTACVGSYIGCLFFYETQGLKYNTQISLKTKKGRKGKKITGIKSMPGCHPGQDMLLVTSNDSRIRLINMKDKSLLYKYTGAENVSMLIKASFSDDGQYIVCGSENFNVYIWKTEKVGTLPMYSKENHIKPISSHDSFGEQMKIASEQTPTHPQETHIAPRLSNWFKRREHRTNYKRPSRDEHFEAHEAVVTSAIFAPTKTRQILANTNKDTIYNNTPVNNLEQKRLSVNQDVKREGSLGTIIDDIVADQKSPLYENGHIIVSADCHGFIKVWRMDSGVYLNSRPSSIKRYSTDIASLAPSLTMSNIDLHDAGCGTSTPAGSMKKRNSPFTKMFPSPNHK